MIRIAIGFALTTIGLTAAMADLGLWPSLAGGLLAGLGLVLLPREDRTDRTGIAFRRGRGHGIGFAPPHRSTRGFSTEFEGHDCRL